MRDNRYYFKEEEKNYKKDDKSGEYLKFLKIRHTPPPQDLQPRRLKYENYYNCYDNIPKAYINILTPTPMKDDKQFHMNQINHINQINQLVVNPNSEYGFNRPNMQVNAQPPQKQQQYNNNHTRNYVSKYPVQISNKNDTQIHNHPNTNNVPAMNIQSNNNKPVHTNNINNPNYNDQYKHNYEQALNNYNNQYANNADQNNNINYKIINAEEFIKSKYNNMQQMSNK